ncbi:tetratricopeptide (TPR) repeat protein [Dysgonomonadaceae bacterium PH5-43]|nr:tetratricopeptide (TPR) repeat protein [Dysgonomonadaceae bacterium PH5-43]
MNQYTKYYFFLFVLLLCIVTAACVETNPLKIQAKEQEQLKPKVKIKLRAAQLAYNVERYDLAVEKYEKAIDMGWLDGIDLYKYADCLERRGDTIKSEIFYKRAYQELQNFYPRNYLIQVLEKKWEREKGQKEIEIENNQ